MWWATPGVFPVIIVGYGSGCGVFRAMVVVNGVVAFWTQRLWVCCSCCGRIVGQSRWIIGVVGLLGLVVVVFCWWLCLFFFLVIVGGRSIVLGLG